MFSLIADYQKIATSKDIIKKVKGQPTEWGKILANHIAVEVLDPEYKRTLTTELNNKRAT